MLAVGEAPPVAKSSKVHFLTSYLEYLYDQGIKSEDYYLGDASRFLRFLLARASDAELAAFLESASSPAYRRRLAKTLKKFYAFANERLEIQKDPTAQLGRI